MTIGQTNVKISDINTENTSTTSNSLKTLSDTAASGTDPADGAPYGMGEFRGYSHGPQNHTVGYVWNGPFGKIGQEYTSAETGITVPWDNTNKWDGFVTMGSGYFRINWTSARSDGWTSLTIGGITLNRTSADVVTSTMHGFYNTNFASSVGSSAFFTYGP